MIEFPKVVLTIYKFTGNFKNSKTIPILPIKGRYKGEIEVFQCPKCWWPQQYLLKLIQYKYKISFASTV